MKKWKIYYTTKDGDSTSCWVSAESKYDAENQLYDEYWDVASVDLITEMD